MLRSFFDGRLSSIAATPLITPFVVAGQARHQLLTLCWTYSVDLGEKPRRLRATQRGCQPLFMIQNHFPRLPQLEGEAQRLPFRFPPIPPRYRNRKSKIIKATSSSSPTSHQFGSDGRAPLTALKTGADGDSAGAAPSPLLTAL